MDRQISIQELYQNRQRLRGTPILDAPNPAFPQEVVIPLATYAPWAADREFLHAFDLVQSHTLVDKYRCHELWTLTAQVSAIEGDALEVGVWRGGTGCLIAAQTQRTAPDKHVFLCDTFSGVVKAGAEDTYYKGGEHADASQSTVEALAGGMELRNISILRGTFPEEVANAIANHRFCLCHIDVDVYRSARDVLDWVWPRLTSGGVVVFDDYGFMGCEGVTKLVCERTGWGGSLMVHNLNGHALLVKR